MCNTQGSFMKIIYGILLFFASSSTLLATPVSDLELIKQSVRNYLVAQQLSQVKPMADALHKNLAKRTYWQEPNGTEFIMETNYSTMLNVAKNYNKAGDKFPESPRTEIEVLDIDQRVASVKLSADDWIDYMHLIKNEHGKWKIINVLWQYHDTEKHGRK